jgi:hypothetical protein
MKEILLFGTMLIAFNGLKAQTLTVNNYTPFDVECVAHADLAGYPCTNYYGPITGHSTGSSGTPSSPATVTLTNCDRLGSLCKHSIVWDAIELLDRSCPPNGYLGIRLGESCSGAPTSGFYYACYDGTMITVTWTNTSGNITVDMH